MLAAACGLWVRSWPHARWATATAAASAAVATATAARARAQVEVLALVAVQVVQRREAGVQQRAQAGAYQRAVLLCAGGSTVDVLLQHITRSPQRIVLDYIVAVE